MIDLNDIATFAKVAQLEASAVRRAPSACPVTPCSVSKGDCPDDGRTRTERKVQRNDHPARSQGAKLDRPAPVSVGFTFHRIRVSICHSLGIPEGPRKQPNMLLVTRSMLDLWTPRTVHPLDQLFKMNALGPDCE